MTLTYIKRKLITIGQGLHLTKSVIMGCIWTLLQRAVSRVHAAAPGLMSVHLQTEKKENYILCPWGCSISEKLNEYSIPFTWSRKRTMICYTDKKCYIGKMCMSRKMHITAHIWRNLLNYESNQGILCSHQKLSLKGIFERKMLMNDINWKTSRNRNKQKEQLDRVW